MVFLLLPTLPSILPALLAAVGLLTLTAVFPVLNTRNRNIPDGVHNLTSISDTNYTEGLPANRYDSRNVSTQIAKIIEAITPKAISGSVENPCEKDNGGCKHFCHVTDGEPKCSCAPGYILGPDEKRCIHMHIKKDGEDQFNSEEKCQQPCVPERNEMVCECPEGYNPDDDKKCCIDVNECEEEMLNNCQHECINTDGGYTCSCRPGYINIDDFKCVDIDECIGNNFGCTHTCVNTPGGAHCYCPEGFMLYGDKTCIAECPPGTKWSETTKVCEQIKRKRGMIINW